MASAVDNTAPDRTTVFVGSVNLVAQLADKLCSFGQIILIAALLGATPAGDLIFLASIVPLTIGYVVGEPVGRAFLTLLIREDRPDEARRLAASAFVLTASTLGLLTVLYMGAASVLVRVFTPDGSASLTPWLILSLIAPFAGLAGLLSGILLWLRDYPWAAARTPIASAAGLALVALAAWGSGRLVWIAAALTAGYALSAVLVYLRVARSLGPGWGFATSRSSLAEAGRVKDLIVGPTIGGAIGGQVIVTIERLLAGALVGTGSVAVVSYARGIATAPTVLAQAIGASGYPTLVRREAAGDTAFLRESFIRGLRLSIFVGACCAAFLVLFGPAAVVAIFQRGKFGVYASNETGRVLIAFAAATFSGSLIAYLVPFIYGLNRFRSIIRLELAIFLVYVTLAPIGALFFGLPGLALAFASAQSCGVIVAIDVCRSAVRLGWGRLARVIFVPIALPVVEVLVLAVVYRLVIDATESHLPVEFRGIVRVGGAALLLGGSMTAALLLSSLPEALQLRRFLSRRTDSERPVGGFGA
jgi:peptidoglycan biosynthesis protein MviN/MurJ (putative lipid II flippase)